MSLFEASVTDAQMLANLISESNKDVAEQFGLNASNNPKHPSFCTKDWILSDFNRGVKYFVFRSEENNAGCVAFEHPKPDLSYLNRLSVLPQFRHRGIGKKLVEHVILFSRSKNIQFVKIGIIANHHRLKQWYQKLGFRETETKKFSHLPFEVTYMVYRC